MARIPLTPEIIAQLNALKEQTGVGVCKLLAGRKDMPRGLSSTTISFWLSGKVKTARQTHLDYVLKEWPKVDKIIPLTPKMRKSIKDGLIKSGISARGLLRILASEGLELDSNIYYFWVTGRVKTIHADIYNAIMAELDVLPKKKSQRDLQEGWLEITPEMLSSLNSHRQRTGIGFTGILKDAHDVPTGLSQAMVQYWMAGTTKTARQIHIDYVMARYAAFPDKLPKRRTSTITPFVTLTPKIVAELKTLKEQTGVGAIALLRGQKNCPKGINAGIINAWLSGKCKTANERHLDFVSKAWKAQTPRIKITDKIYKEIRAEMQRTGSSATTLMNRLLPVPVGFTKNILDSILARSAKTMPQDYFNYLMDGLKNLPDKAMSQKMPYLKRDQGVRGNSPQKTPYLGRGQMGDFIEPEKKPYIGGLSKDIRSITKEERDEMESHIQRTGIGIPALLRKFAHTKPDKLHASTIQQWRNNQIKRTSPDRMKWVLDKWRSLPDKPQK